MCCAPLQRKRQQQLQAGRAGLGFGERQVLAVLIHRRMVRAQAVDSALGQTARERVAIALASEGRLEPAMRIEVAEIHVAQMQMVDRDVAAHRQAFLLGMPHHLHRAGRRQPAYMDPCPRGADQLQNGTEGDGLRERGDAGQPESRRDLAVVRHAVLRKPGIFRAQPYRVSKRGRILQRAPQQLRVAQRHVALRKRDTTGLAELGHLGERLAPQLYRQRSQRIDARAGKRLGAPTQHVDESRLVERRIGVRRAGKRGNAARHRCIHLGLQRGFVLVARLPQPRRKVDEAGRNDQSLRVDHSVRS